MSPRRGRLRHIGPLLRRVSHMRGVEGTAPYKGGSVGRGIPDAPCGRRDRDLAPTEWSTHSVGEGFQPSLFGAVYISGRVRDPPLRFLMRYFLKVRRKIRIWVKSCPETGNFFSFPG